MKKKAKTTGIKNEWNAESLQQTNLKLLEVVHFISTLVLLSYLWQVHRQLQQPPIIWSVLLYGLFWCTSLCDAIHAILVEHFNLQIFIAIHSKCIALITNEMLSTLNQSNELWLDVILCYVSWRIVYLMYVFPGLNCFEIYCDVFSIFCWLQRGQIEIKPIFFSAWLRLLLHCICNIPCSYSTRCVRSQYCPQT